jgi:hypothetical protein
MAGGETWMAPLADAARPGTRWLKYTLFLESMESCAPTPAVPSPPRRRSPPGVGTHRAAAEACGTSRQIAQRAATRAAHHAARPTLMLLSPSSLVASQTAWTRSSDKTEREIANRI